MRVKSLKLRNFRNYAACEIEFRQGKNIVIGDNAQGKTNLLEAVDYLSTGKSARASDDKELVFWGAQSAGLELLYESRNYSQTLSVDIALKEVSRPGLSGRCQKQFKVNGVAQQGVKGLLGHLITVSFSADDLKILRGGPKYRRDWLDNLALRLKPTFHDTLSSYAKSLLQRNKLLKSLSEKGRLSVVDQDELSVWDKQVAKFGTYIIKMRLKMLADLLPIAEVHQSSLSRASEKLSIDYVFRAQEESGDSGAADDDAVDNPETPVKSMEELEKMEDLELARFLLKLMKERRFLELRRRQSLVGPHRDNLVFKLNGASASSFASQGQQRSVVLSLKLAELNRVEEHIGESPVLLLDDVLAELDEKRAALLLSCVTSGMQTIISTTHLTAIEPGWLEDAHVMNIKRGALAAAHAGS